jgi:S-(hydroxymethyl)glutathione dehydrogenase/alcohol dehydrogenase
MELEIDEPIGHEVLIDVQASGLCRSDLSLVENDFGYTFPAVLGHELAGVVTKVGPDVATIKPGDHVVGCLLQFCGTCLECVSGRTYDCLNPGATLRTADQPPRLRTTDGARIEQAFGLGGFAEQALVHENQLAVVNDETPFSAAALIGCGVVTGAGAVINTANVRVGDSVAVIGTGGVGLNAISGAILAGASTVIAVDVADDKLAVARKFGATHTINSSTTDPVAEVMRITGRGVDHAFEVIGLAVTQEQAAAMRKPRGGAYFVGLAKPGTTFTMDSSLAGLALHATVQSVNMGSTNLKRDIPMYADLYTQGRLNLDDLVSQEIGIDDVNDGYAAVKAGGVIRSVITSF